MAKERSVDLSAGAELPLGSRIRLVRQASRIRLTAMARAVGYDKGYISQVETNRANPSDDLIKKIAAYLEVPVEHLRKAPLAVLVPAVTSATYSDDFPSLAFTALPPTQATRRSLAQRLARIVSVARLSDEEEELVSDAATEIIEQLVQMILAARRLGSDSAQPSGKG